MKYREACLYRRTSHKYRGGWAYLDNEEFVSDVTIINEEGEEDYTEDGDTYYRGSFDLLLASSPPIAIACEAIRDTFRVDNCQHEYDCCGCLSISVREIEKLDADFYRVSLGGSRNY